MTRPISTELAHIYVTGDNKKFLYLEDAKRHQETLERDEVKDAWDSLTIEYYSNNIGKESSITGAIITESMISTLQIRYRELYGHYFNL